MDVVVSTIGRVVTWVTANTADAILAVAALALLALLVAIWSLVRRRGVRRLRRQVRHLEQRVRRLELSGERQRTVAAIGPGEPDAADV